MQVVRAKNGLDQDYNARPTAGFRAVVLNLCFHTNGMRRLGVEHHVCKLQLVLRQMLVMDVDEEACAAPVRHMRYLRLRALRPYLWGGAVLSGWADKTNRVTPTLEEVGVEAELPTLSPPALPPSSGTDRQNGLGDTEDHVLVLDALDAAVAAAAQEEKVGLTIFTGSALNVSRLQGRAEVVYRALQLSSSGSVFFTCNLLAAMGSTRVGAVLMVLFTIFCFYFGVSLIYYLQSHAKIQFASVTAVLVVTELRGGGAVEGAQIGDFRLLSNGCQLSAASKSTRLNRFGVGFDDIFLSDGYYFTTSAGPADNDPVRWEVLVTSAINATAGSSLGHLAGRAYGTSNPITNTVRQWHPTRV